MISKLIRNMSTPSRIPIRTNLLTNKYNLVSENNTSSYSYMYQALVKNKINNFSKNKSNLTLNKTIISFNDQSCTNNDNDNNS